MESKSNRFPPFHSKIRISGKFGDQFIIDDRRLTIVGYTNAGSSLLVNVEGRVMRFVVIKNKEGEDE